MQAQRQKSRVAWVKLQRSLNTCDVRTDCLPLEQPDQGRPDIVCVMLKTRRKRLMV